MIHYICILFAYEKAYTLFTMSNFEEGVLDNEFSDSYKKEKLIRDGHEITLQIHDGITHHFKIERVLKLEDVEPSPSNFVESINISDLSQIAVPAQEGLTPERVRQYLEWGANGGIQEYLELLDQNGSIAPIKLEEIKQDYVYHAGASLFIDQDGKPIDKIEAIKSTGKYGGEGRVSYFGLNPSDALSHGLGNYNNITNRGEENLEAKILLLKINVSKLRDKRNIFIDPESLIPGFSEEFGNNFIVHNGIPNEAIEEIEVLKYEGYREEIEVQPLRRG